MSIIQYDLLVYIYFRKHPQSSKSQTNLPIHGSIKFVGNGRNALRMCCCNTSNMFLFV